MLNATTTARHAGAPSPLTEQAKVDAIICLLQLSTHLRPCHLLDRVLPHLVELTGAAGFIASTPSPAGTATAATAAAVDVDLAPGAVSAMGFSTVGPATGGSGGGVSATTTNGAAFFDLAYLTEYLLPSLTGLSLDPDPEVRLAVARCLPVLAEASLCFDLGR
ncbi:unnamed protein product [Protopolystoma xenopodis]|uniref:Uncharacterized protein n=1 Tax=Protopolystoma xenopodis TaxID=117903 RepID=A0A3S5C930_9PLAT|nr:unnamed protein product [Protopolystoma xenopodis]